MRDAHRLADHLVEIHEDFASKQIVELVLARGVLAHQPLERGDFVCGVVIDVQVWPPREAPVDEIDEALEGDASLPRIERLKGARSARRSLQSTVMTPKRYSRPRRGSKYGSPSMSKKTSPWRRLWEQSKPVRSSSASNSYRCRPVCRKRRLQCSLLPQPSERDFARFRCAGLASNAAERRDGPDASLVELLDLLAADVRRSGSGGRPLPIAARSRAGVHTGCSAPRDRDTSAWLTP